MATAAEKLSTVGDIAREEGVPKHRVEYAIEQYRVQETQRAGIIRLFDAAKVAAIRSALARITANSGNGL